MIKFATRTLQKIWDGFLQNLGVYIPAFFFSVSYLWVTNAFDDLKLSIRAIPTDYILTPLVLLVVVLIMLIRLNHTQKMQITNLLNEPEDKGDNIRFVTHFGVWWRIYFDSDYIEDFPYCACCEPYMKLVQTEWYPNEKFKCSKTGTEYELFDGVPRKLEDSLRGLYRTYFESLGQKLKKIYRLEMHRIRELHPNISDKELTRKLFLMHPLCLIPEDKINEILDVHEEPYQAWSFIEKNAQVYRAYIRKGQGDKNT